MIKWRHIIGTTKAKVGKESKDFHIEEWWIVHNGPSQQTMTMFDIYGNVDGDERIVWRTIRRASCN
jgi:hypothetical protein